MSLVFFFRPIIKCLEVNFADDITEKEWERELGLLNIPKKCLHFLKEVRIRKNTVHLYFSLIPSTFTLELREAPPKIQHNVQPSSIHFIHVSP